MRAGNRGVPDRGESQDGQVEEEDHLQRFSLCFSDRGLVKVNLVLARGKTNRDKRSYINKRAPKRDMARAMRRRLGDPHTYRIPFFHLRPAQMCYAGGIIFRPPGDGRLGSRHHRRCGCGGVTGASSTLVTDWEDQP
ncbi:MAG: SsrA-binding protein [Planctomycetes bacterium]|nr:SsrA-binding protein [Planctomycetota bacterium]